MAFILSANRVDPAAITEVFRKYRAYLASVKDRFPPSAFELATSEWYFSCGRKSPHDSWLEAVEIKELASGPRQEVRSLRMVIKLFASYHDGHIELAYTDVLSYSLGCTRRGSQVSHGDWLWDEFTVSPTGKLIHDIEWEHGLWRIEASDVEYTWKPFAPQS